MLPDRFTIIPRVPRPMIASPAAGLASPAAGLASPVAGPGTPWRPAALAPPPRPAPVPAALAQSASLQPLAVPPQPRAVVPSAPPGAPPGAPPPSATAPTATTPTATTPADGGPPLGADEFVPVPGEMTFAQFLEGLNPLHHLPVVGSIYRAATGTEIHPVMRVLGGGVLGGPVGMILGAIGAAFEMTQPLQRLGHTLAGRPDPWLTPPQPAANSGGAPLRAAAAYALHGQAG
jgi:hypothetical protein